MATNFEILVDQRIDAYQQQKPKRTGSFIVTLFGDLMPIEQDGVWLQDITEILSDFGISSGLVRTSMTRLVQDGWLSRHQVGRNSVYAFAEDSKADANTAADKIYQINRSIWEGDFQQIILLNQNQHSRSEKEMFKRQLSDFGFVKLKDAIFIKPNYQNKISKNVMKKVLETDFILSDQVAFDLNGGDEKMLQTRWELDALNTNYQDFYKIYHEFIALIEKTPASELNARACLNLRLLLIHDYRKICLKDPMLPQNLLKSDWMGYKCQSLVQAIYTKLTPIVGELLLERKIKLSAQHDARFK